MAAKGESNPFSALFKQLPEDRWHKLREYTNYKLSYKGTHLSVSASNLTGGKSKSNQKTVIDKTGIEHVFISTLMARAV